MGSSSISLFDGFLMGLVQGLSEFLPISSSGHLILARSYFNIAEVPLLFDILLHCATLLAVLIAFRKRIGELLLSFFRWVGRSSTDEDSENLRYIVMIIVATLLTLLVALLFKALHIEATTKVAVSSLLLVTALLLASTPLAPKYVTPSSKLTYKSAIVAGIAQGIGTLAGISRSGATITGALWSGVEREKAGEFSFILSIPAIIGALILSLNERGALQESVGTLSLIVGSVTALVVGFLTLKLLLWMIKSSRLSLFSLYLLVVGLFGLIITV